MQSGIQTVADKSGILIFAEADPIGESGNGKIFFKEYYQYQKKCEVGHILNLSNGRMFNNLSISFPWINRGTDIEITLKQ